MFTVVIKRRRACSIVNLGLFSRKKFKSVKLTGVLPKAYNDRLLLGLKGTMSEAELHIIKQRLVEAMRQKARRGELRRRLPAGYFWNEAGRIQKDPDEQVGEAIDLVFNRFSVLETVHQTYLSLCEDKVRVPVSVSRGKGVEWKMPSSGQVLRMLTNPIYAGAYARQ